MFLRCLFKLILPLALVLIGFVGVAQNNLKYRFSANSGLMLSEGSSLNIPDPLIIDNITPGGSDEFKPEFKIGFELEISVPVSELFSIGLEFESSTLKGVNENPIYFNYFAEQIAVGSYNQQPLMYTTYLNSLVGNVRYFPLGVRTFQPFIKAFSGVSFVGTNLQFHDPQDQANIFDPLYTRGTKSSTETRWPAFYYGFGLGFERHISEYVSIYFDASFSILETDLVDGVPNFSYNEVLQANEHVDASTFAAQITIGFCYSFYRPGNDSKSSTPKRAVFKKRKGKIDKYFPFHEIKQKL